MKPAQQGQALSGPGVKEQGEPVETATLDAVAGEAGADTPTTRDSAVDTPTAAAIADIITATDETTATSDLPRPERARGDGGDADREKLMD